MLFNKASVKSRAGWGLSALAMMVVLGSCGGGGSSSQAPVNVTPQPSNAAPTAAASSDKTTVQEGQPFELDASASMDPEGAALTFQWTQTAGTPVTLGPADTALLSLNAAEVTQDETATFQVSVSDGTNASRASVNVNFSNIAQTPVFNPGTRFEKTLSLSEPVTHLMQEISFGSLGIGFAGTAANSTDGVNLQGFVIDASENLVTTSNAPNFQSFSQPLITFLRPGIRYPWLGFRERIVEIIETSENKVGFYSDSADPFLEIDVAEPCTSLTLVDSSAEGSQIAIGKGSGGLSVFNLSVDSDGDVVTSSAAFDVGTTESFCELAPLNFPLTEYSGIYAFQRDRVLAFDEDAQTFSVLSPSYTGALVTSYSVAETVPVELETGSSLSFVGSAVIPNEAMALIFTDGNHEGIHRLVVAGLGGDEEVYQETYSWAIGAPSSVSAGFFGDSSSTGHIMIVSETSPEAIIFTKPNVTPGFGALTTLPLTGPAFYEIGLGGKVNLAASGAIGSGNVNGMYVGYGGKAQVKYFGVKQ